MDSGDFVYKPNKTYLVVMAYFFQQGQTRTFIPLNVIDCTSQELQGYKCLDFSQVSNYTFALNTLQDLYSQIQIFTYGCLDVDKVKTTVPDDCASQDDINTLVNGVNVGLRYKIYTAQFNTTSQQMQSDYRNILVYTFASQAVVTFLNMQTQTTNVKQGLIWQSNSYYSSPLQYGQINQSMDRKSALNDGQGPFNSFVLQMDEIVYQIQIQYTTLPQILALVNGIFSLLMTVGYLGRRNSQKQINNDFFMLFLQNIFSGQYFKILKSSKLLLHDQKQNNLTTYLDINNNLLENKQTQFDTKENNKNNIQDDIYQQQYFEKQKNDLKINLPNFKVKLKGSLECSQVNPKETNLQSINSDFQKTQYHKRNKFRGRIEEKFSNQQKYTEDQNISNDQETIAQFSMLSPTQSLTQQISPKNTFLKNRNMNQNWFQFSNLLYLSPNQKSNNHKKVIQTQSINEERYLAQDLRRNTLQQNNLNIKCQIYKLKALQSENISRQVLQKISKQLHSNSSKKSQEFSNQNQKMIQNQIANDLNIYQLYKDILFLKKAIMVMLNQEQLAAIKFLGCSSSFLDLKSEILNLNLLKLNALRKENKINYLDQQFLIYQSEQLQQEEIEQFLLRVQNHLNINEIDERLISSLPQL